MYSFYENVGFFFNMAWEQQNAKGGERWRMVTIVTFPIRRGGAVLFSDIVSLGKTEKNALSNFIKFR